MKPALFLFLLLTCRFLTLHAQIAFPDDAGVPDDLRMAQLVKSGSFLFEANRITPSGGPSRSLVTFYNFIKIHGGAVEAELPYYGEVRLSGGYDRSGGIAFQGDMSELKVEYRARTRQILLRFNAGNASEQFNVTFFINPSGWSNVVVKSMYRPTTTYYGKVRAREPEREQGG